MTIRTILAIQLFTLAIGSVFAQQKAKIRPEMHDYQNLFHAISKMVPQNGDFVLKFDSSKIIFASPTEHTMLIGVSPSQINGFDKYNDIISYSIYLVPRIPKRTFAEIESQNRRLMADAGELQKRENRKTHVLDSKDPIVLNFLCNGFIPLATHKYNHRWDILVVEEKKTYFAEPAEKEQIEQITAFFQGLHAKFPPKNPAIPHHYFGRIAQCMKL